MSAKKKLKQDEKVYEESPDFEIQPVPLFTVTKLTDSTFKVEYRMGDFLFSGTGQNVNAAVNAMLDSINSKMSVWTYAKLHQQKVDWFLRDLVTKGLLKGQNNGV